MSAAIISEWTKLRTVRSTVWTAVITVIVTIALSAIVSALTASSWSKFSAADKAQFDPTNASLPGLAFGVLAIGVLGILAICSEYGHGTMASTLAAVPARWRLLGAKSLVVGVAALAIAEAMTLAAFLLGQQLLSGRAPHATLADPGVVRAIALSGVGLAALALFAHGLGYLIRNSAGTIAVYVGVILVLPAVVSALPAAVQNGVEQFTPLDILSSSVSTTVRDPHSLTPWAGAAVLLAYAIVALGLGGLRLARRDA